MKDLKPTNNMTITKEQFDNLQVGDELKNEYHTLLVEAKFANSILVMDDEHDAAYLSFKELKEQGYSINQPIQHNCGFPYGNYSDREVVVKISNESIDKCKNSKIYIRLMNVGNGGFQDDDGEYWMYAILVSNNVDIVK